jgi:hypothetical protein
MERETRLELATSSLEGMFTDPEIRTATEP